MWGTINSSYRKKFSIQKANTEIFQYNSHYSASKAVAEKEVLASDCSALRTCALRYRGIYGPAEPRIVQRVVVSFIFYS